MELQARCHGVGVSAFGWLGYVRRRHERDTRACGRWGDGTGSVQPGSRHTISETWVTTSTRARRVKRAVGGHEVSKPKVIVVSWSAERIGPRIIVAPQRGHAQ